MESIAPKKMRIGVGVMMMREEKILLGRRHSDPGKADSELHGEGSWTMPGGKLEFGESFEDGARREVKEETGAEGKIIRALNPVTYWFVMPSQGGSASGGKWRMKNQNSNINLQSTRRCFYRFFLVNSDTPGFY